MDILDIEENQTYLVFMIKKPKEYYKEFKCSNSFREGEQ